MNQKSSLTGRRWPLLVTLLIACGIIALVILEKTNTTHFFHKQAVPVTASSSTKGEPTVPNPSAKGTASSAGTNSNSSANNAQPGDNKSTTGGEATSETLQEPTGNFVSNHYPGKGGSPLTETSVCTTSPGAVCQITFTKDGETKSLASQTTDRGGSTYWNNWNVQDVLSTGSWQVHAIATQNGQTKETVDAIPLVVQ